MAASGLRGGRGRGCPPRCPLPSLCPPRGPAPAPPRPRAIDRASFGMPVAAVGTKLGQRPPPSASPTRPPSGSPSSPKSRPGLPDRKPPPPQRARRLAGRRGGVWRGRTRRPGVHFESLKLRSGGRGRAGEAGAGGGGKKDGCSRGSAPGRGRRAGPEGRDECVNPFLAVPRPPSRPRAPARPAPPARSGSFHSRRRGARLSAPAKSGSSRGEGTRAPH